ncbi:BamA/TamA family outer membrane protein [Jannaschia sp. S6380]|uniref:autotransporter assembly complex protein TamA n=1 Tax=Jannaschia sp. S6380 TaxID=2926408 RepID=UPI001FF2BC14|nr:BamA/TamA family outer membrane protein [Jannaschia sp. S6380]MCK0169047.1 BamA/TamA family outer membrane protein [Jannaschia sp. S6380]
MRLLIATGLALSLWAGASAAADLQIAIAGDPDTFEDLAEDIRAASLTAGAVEEDESQRRDIVAAAQADYRRLLAVLFEAGYFGPVISITIDGVEAAALPTIGQQGGVNSVAIQIQPGPRFLFGQAAIAPVARGTELPEGFAPGLPAGTDVIRQAARAGVEGWRARGHAKAEVADQQITARHEIDRLDVALSLAPGPRLVFGPVFVEGAEDVRASHISRIADLRQGRVFDPGQVEEAARRLQRTGAFSSVSITEAERIGPADTLPMTISVVERLPRRFGFGAEIASEEGLGLSAYWLHRNLTGYADSLRIEGNVEQLGASNSGADYSLTFAYLRPATFNPESDLFVNGGAESLDQPNFNSERAYLEVGARRIVSDEFQYSYGVGYEYSKTSDAFGTREFSILSLPLTAQYDRRDDPLNTRDGYYIEAGLRPFQGFRTAGTGAVFDADLRGYQGFGPDRRTVVAARLQLGSVIGPELDEVPAKTLFFSGGGGTVRGQEFQSLGVELDDGDIVGGRSFVGFSAELRQDVTERIGVVGFADFGLISPDSDFTGGDSHSGAGLGLRYDTGIGPLRLDLGFPVSGPDDDGGVGIYIGIGQAF